MIPQLNQMNQRTILDNNYNNNIIPNCLEMVENINENLMDYKNNLQINQEIKQNKKMPNLNYQYQNPDLISSTQNIIGRNESFKTQYILNNYQKIINDLQYTNALINKKNLDLESELEFIKNKYNAVKNDINDINNHISICKENQDKIISELIERNTYLENLISPNDKNDKKFDEKKELLENKSNINLNLNLFIYKMKKLFNNPDIDGKIKDEDYLNILYNNVLKINEELIITKKELEKKYFELSRLEKENHILKEKLQQMHYNNKPPINIYKNNSNYQISSIDYRHAKTPMERSQIMPLAINDNISNFDFKDNYSNYSQNKSRFPLFIGKYKSHSPSPLRNNLINNLSKSPNVSDFKIQTYNTENISNLSFPFKNNKILEKRLVNSRSIGSMKFKTLNDLENDKNNNKYQFPKATLVSQQCANSKNSLQSLMNNVAQLESALKETQNNIYEDNMNRLS